MAVTKEEIEQARQDRRNELNQGRMEKEIYGEPLPLPKPGQKETMRTLPGKPEKKKDLGAGAIMYSKGGSASARADGCAQRGKTRGKMV